MKKCEICGEWRKKFVRCEKCGNLFCTSCYDKVYQYDDFGEPICPNCFFDDNE